MILITEQIHAQLCAQGYKYFMLKDVRRIEVEISALYILQAVKDMPAICQHSCMGINDQMVLTIIAGHMSHIHLYLEMNVVGK